MAGLIERFTDARRQAFVGRERELARFRAAFDAGTGSIWYVHGPGGVGKTSLLHQVAWLAERAGRPVRWYDVRDPPEPPDHGAVLVVDNAEPPDAWLTERVVSTLPADAMAVLAGRGAPPLTWRVDPGWRGLVETVALGNLSTDEAVEVLARHGVPAADRETAATATHGHPLALALVADVSAHGGVATASGPELVNALLSGLLDAMPSGLHRMALEASAQVRTTTEPLLAALLDRDQVRELFDWLRELSIMEYGPAGLAPHDIARDALSAELRWRHPERHAELHARAGAYYRQQLDAVPPSARPSVLRDFAYLHRHSPVLGPFLAPAFEPGAGSLRVRPAGPDDHAAVLDALRSHEGETAATLARHWLTLRPQCTFVVEDAGRGVAGYFDLLRLDAVSADEEALDPGVAATLGYLRAEAPLRAGETATLVRNWLDLTLHQGISPVQMCITLYLVQHYLTMPELAFSGVAYTDPDFWLDACRYADLVRLPEADFTAGARSYGVYGHDWRAVPPMDWLTLLAAREHAGDDIGVPAAEPRPAVLRVLDADAFAVAVRRALADLGRADRLVSSPLLRSRLVGRRLPADAGDADRVRVLQKEVRDAATQLQAVPRLMRGYRALHHTYLQPAESQQAAADLLRLPMSTFRRHLTEGVRELTEVLWRRETGPEVSAD